jgi:arylsulfatase A-like enzyme
MMWLWLAMGVVWGAEPPNLILISMDTTRADALSCYGKPPDLHREVGIRTPVLDGLAAEGVRLDQFFVHAPTTLNSHTTMLSGLDPHQHAVPRNGFVVPSGLRTLPQRLAEQGYDTIGVVAAAALAERFGLGRGFRVYDADMSHRQSVMYQDRAEGVFERVERQLDARVDGEPLFLFVHFYDPHAPYAAPGEFRQRFVDPAYDGEWKRKRFDRQKQLLAVQEGDAKPADIDHIAALYLGEVAYVDHHIGLLMSSLEGRGLLENALVVVTADHGESLSETVRNGYSHGGDVRIEATRVPLILWASESIPLARSAVVTRQAEMAALAPTLEVALGLEPTLGSRTPFWDLVRPGPVDDSDGWPARPTRTVVMEATRPRELEQQSKWNNLPFARGIRAGGFVLRGAPVFAQAFELEARSTPLLERLMLEMLWAWDDTAPPHREERMDAETERALRALGYLD